MRLAATDLSLERGGRIIFAHLGFSLDSGEALAVVGVNGAGKSSLLRALAGLLTPATGQIELLPMTDMPRAEACHYLGHADALKGVLTVTENLSFWSAMLSRGEARNESRPSIEDVLRRFGLKGVADLPAAYLSAGQRRRTALARLLLAPRPIWLLDEPLTALDVASQELLRQVMRTHLDTGGMIVAATHAPLGLPARELLIGQAP